MSGRPCLQSDVHVQGPLLSEAIFLSISHKLAKSLQARAWKDFAKRAWKAWHAWQMLQAREWKTLSSCSFKFKHFQRPSPKSSNHGLCLLPTQCITICSAQRVDQARAGPLDFQEPSRTRRTRHSMTQSH